MGFISQAMVQRWVKSFTSNIEKYWLPKPRSDARLNQAFEVSAELGKSLEIRSNPNTRQMIIGIIIIPCRNKAEEQNTAYELLYSFLLSTDMFYAGYFSGKYLKYA